MIVLITRLLKWKSFIYYNFLRVISKSISLYMSYLSIQIYLFILSHLYTITIIYSLSITYLFIRPNHAKVSNFDHFLSK